MVPVESSMNDGVKQSNPMATTHISQKIIARYVLLSVIIFVLIAAAIFAWPQTSRPFDSSPDASTAVAANTAFAIDLYQELKTQPGNLFFSPYSISSALAMTYAGARGQTESEMTKVLHFDPGQTNVHAGFHALTYRINDLQRWNRIKLLTANSLWCQQDYRFKDTFLNLVKRDYHAEARPVDFEKAPDFARSQINRWVSQKTDGKIQNIMAPGSVSPETRLVLCNAIYFKGKWQAQFKTRDTRPAAFYVSSNETVTVPMMSLDAYFKRAYIDDASVGLLELPYVGNDLSMVILLPGNAMGPGPGEMSEMKQASLSDLEEKLTPENLHSWLALLDRAASEKESISLPRFTTTQSFDLTENLKAMGMPSAFGDTADLSGMDGTRGLYLSSVLHKAFVQVDESGMEAAAATAVTVIASVVAQPFVVDHPFIFLIRDNGSGTILFMGRIVDPTK
jgi:serine protease inhibitor